MNGDIDLMKSDSVFHVYNRSNGSEFLFKEEFGREFFIENIKKYILPIAHIYAYCLMKNHFHLLLKIKSEEIINNLKMRHYLKSQRIEIINEFHSKNLQLQSNEKFISQVFSNMFNSYSKSFNIYFDRHGNLFERPFHRKLVNDESYYKYLFFYIHENPIRGKLYKNFKDSSWSSYNEFINNSSRILDIETVFRHFGGRLEFIEYHENILKKVRERNNWLIKSDFIRTPDR
jgi:putative transposase